MVAYTPHPGRPHTTAPFRRATTRSFRVPIRSINPLTRKKTIRTLPSAHNTGKTLLIAPAKKTKSKTRPININLSTLRRKKSRALNKVTRRNITRKIIRRMKKHYIEKYDKLTDEDWEEIKDEFDSEDIKTNFGIEINTGGGLVYIEDEDKMNQEGDPKRVEYKLTTSQYKVLIQHFVHIRKQFDVNDPEHKIINNTLIYIRYQYYKDKYKRMKNKSEEERSKINENHQGMEELEELMARL
jgi:hypothetical protein